MSRAVEKKDGKGSTEINEAYLPTVAEILKLPIFEKVRLYGGKKRMEKKVGGVYIMDVPDYEKWIAPGEILVSTCFAIHDDKEALKKLIPALNRRKASAAFVKPGRFLGAMPETMIREAKKLSFPLIELPNEVRFADITKAVSDEILRRQQDVLQMSLSVNEMLTQMITAGADLREIAEQISGLVSGTVLIRDNINGRDAVAVHRKDETALSVKDDTALVKRIMKYSHAYEIMLNEEQYGTLYLYGEKPESAYEEMLHHVVKAVPLEIGRYRSVREHEERNFNDFFLHLISDQIKDETRETVRAQAVSFDLDEAHQLIQMRVTDSFSTESYGTLLKRDFFVQSLRVRLRELHVSSRVIDDGRGFYLLLGDDDGEDGKRAQTVEQIKKIIAGLIRSNRELTIAVGGSRWHGGIAGLKACTTEATLALKHASAYAKSHITMFDDLGMIRLLYAADPVAETDHFITDVLRDLVTNRTEKEDALLETLDAFFEHQGNQRKMADALFIHYNTVAYRMDQIEERTGLDLKSHADRLRAEFALYLLHHLQSE